MQSNQTLTLTSYNSNLSSTRFPISSLKVIPHQVPPAPGICLESEQCLLLSPHILELVGTTCSRKQPSSTVFWIAYNYYWSFLGTKLFQKFGKHSAYFVAEAGSTTCGLPSLTPECFASWDLGTFSNLSFHLMLSFFHPMIHVLKTHEVKFFILFFFKQYFKRQYSVAELRNTLKG